MINNNNTITVLRPQLPSGSNTLLQLDKGEEEKKLLQECLMEEVEKERESKELAVSDVRREMERKMYELQVTNQQMRLQAAHLLSSFESVKQAYAVLSRQARQFPQMVTVVLKETRTKVGVEGFG